MKKTSTLSLGLVLLGMVWTLNTRAFTQLPINTAQADVSSFWQRFRDAVIKGDKVAVAALSQFPIAMPYGMPTVKNRAQLTRRYRDVFHHETSAAKCFETAQPVMHPARQTEFTVGCKNSAGDEVIIYSFERRKNGWRFTGLDNINE